MNSGENEDSTSTNQPTLHSNSFSVLLSSPSLPMVPLDFFPIYQNYAVTSKLESSVTGHSKENNIWFEVGNQILQTGLIRMCLQMTIDIYRDKCWCTLLRACQNCWGMHGLFALRQECQAIVLPSRNTICCQYEKESSKGRRLTRLVVIYPEKLMIMVPKSWSLEKDIPSQSTKPDNHIATTTAATAQSSSSCSANSCQECVCIHNQHRTWPKPWFF